MRSRKGFGSSTPFERRQLIALPVHHRSLLALKQHGSLHGIYAFHMDFYYYSFRFRKGIVSNVCVLFRYVSAPKHAPPPPNQEWNYQAKIVDGKTFKEDPSMTFNKLRSERAPVLPLRGGWHMSYFGGVDFIQNKLQSFSHQEYNNDQYNNPESILKAMESGTDLFGRAEEQLHTVELEDNAYLPLHYAMLMPTSDARGR